MIWRGEVVAFEIKYLDDSRGEGQTMVRTDEVEAIVPRRVVPQVSGNHGFNRSQFLFVFLNKEYY